MKKIFLIMPILAGIMFGSAGFFVRTLTENGIDSMTLLFIRFSIAIIIMLLVIFANDKSLFKVDRSDIFPLIICGLCILGLNLFYNHSMNMVPLSLAAVLLDCSYGWAFTPLPLQSSPSQQRWCRNLEKIQARRPKPLQAAHGLRFLSYSFLPT